VPLFHRHARGLILTEQGELLFRTAHDVFMKLETVRTMLADSKEKPNGELRITTAVGLGSYWLSSRIGEFLDLYPGIRIQLLMSDEELDLSMREADVAIRLWQPVQPDLIQRKLFTVHFHAYATADYLKRHGHPRSPEELDEHRILIVGGSIPHYYQRLNWLRDAGRPPNDPRQPALAVNNVIGLKLACENGVGIATLARLSAGGIGRSGAALRRQRGAVTRGLFRLSRGTAIGRARAGVPRLSRVEGAALEVLKIVQPHPSRRILRPLEDEADDHMNRFSFSSPLYRSATNSP
jgi:DNA-binding transcriptional LysR family regulator